MTITGPFGSSRYGKTENGSLVAIEADDVAWMAYGRSLENMAAVERFANQAVDEANEVRRCRDRVFPSQMNLPATVDAGVVRLGGFAPTLAPTADAGKVRLGGFAPALAPAVRP